jgi:uncharacterized protein YjeT (DUF2065 family)
MKLLVSLIGLVLVLEGLPYAAFPDAMQKWLRQMVDMPPRYLRIFGFLAMAAGLFLCYLTQRTAILG